MVLSFIRRWKRDKLREEPFPEAWHTHVERHLPAAKSLSAEEREDLEDLIRIFVEEKHFEGCGGLELTEEMRVAIAARACLLLLGMDIEAPYPDLVTILVYPSAYKSPQTRIEGGIVSEGDVARLGESWDRGVVVLAWDAVLKGARDPKDGKDVVLHEFAHQLDQESGAADGAPVLDDASDYGPWARVFGKAFDAHVRATHKGARTVMDEYGATNPAEFFAVATEAFFERPALMRTKHPELYRELVAYYGRDPGA